MKNQWKSLLLLATALCVVLGYALCRNEIRFDVRLKKANLAKAFEPRHTDSSVEAGLAASAKAREDSIRAAREHPDTTRQRILFFVRQRLEIRHIAYIVHHLPEIGHSRQYHHNPLEACGKADSVARGAHISEL